MSRELLAREALGQIPKILTLQDRNPHSPTYGCFDRNFWHYKILDFPSGMAQELVWPLALAWSTELPGNPFHGAAAVRDWIVAGVRYAAASAHADGSCDDYFPHERAAGAAAFSLLACLESYELVGLDDEPLRRFFAARADWLAAHEESGRLSNHHALTVLALARLGRLLGTDRWREAGARRLERLLQWQSAEGWFQEYDGCDPGYHTLTLGCLAQLHDLHPSAQLEEALERAIGFAAEMVHPDGSYGGEIGSRNTFNFFPHGFEVAGRWAPHALAVNDGFLAGLAAGRGPCHADDHILGHHAWSYLLAWRHWVPQRPAPAPRRSGRVWLSEARILIERREDTELYAALGKGGVFKLFRGGELVASDTQVSLRVGCGSRARNAVAHLMDAYRIQLADDEISVRGSLGWAKQARMTPPRLLALRVLALSIGRFAPNLLRRFLQRLLITGKRTAPFTFARTFAWQAGRWLIRDEVSGPSWEDVRGAGIGGHQTSIHVVMSRTYEPGQLVPWRDLTPEVGRLGPGEALRIERSV
ncbi:MAG: hypothetical protein H0V09_05000 [Gemmatimonadetes bacterium]|nr:hypothetical protein [Gemmatimonadota bacterium]